MLLNTTRCVRCVRGDVQLVHDQRSRKAARILQRAPSDKPHEMNSLADATDRSIGLHTAMTSCALT